MLKTYQFKTQCKGDIYSSKTANIILPGLVTEYRWMLARYTFRIVSKFKCIYGCWLKQLVSPSLNTTSLVHVRAFTYIFSHQSWQNDIFSFRAMNVALTVSFKLIRF